MARVLVTGATGLIGRAATAALIGSGHEVLAVSRTGAAVHGTRAISCDLLNADQTGAMIAEVKADQLLHLAWHDGPRDRWVSVANLSWMSASLTLVQAFAAAGGGRAVCAGSCAEYDWSGDAELAETSPLRPATLYGAAKAGTGLALMAAAPQLGLSLAWARIFFVYGPGEPKGRLLGDLVRGLRAGEIVECSDGLQERDFLHVDDLGAALATLVEGSIAGPVNVASGLAIPVQDLIREVAGQIGRTDLVRLGARPRPPGDPPRLAANVDRLTEGAGFAPRHDLASGVAAVLAHRMPE